MLQKEKQQLQLASRDQDHTYQDKFALVEHLTHAAGVSVIKLWARLGLDVAQVMTWLSTQKQQQQQELEQRATPIVILYFVGKQNCHFIQEEQVEIELGGANVGKRKVREIQKVTEYSWNVTESYEMYACLGGTATSCHESDNNNNNSNKLDMTSRTMQAVVTTRTKDPPVRTQNIMERVAITWWLEQFGKFVISNKKASGADYDDDDDSSTTATNEAMMVRSFSIDRNLATTPRRNPQIDHVMNVQRALYESIDSKILTFFRHLSLYPPGHENALKQLTLTGYMADPLPSLLPVFENSTILPLETLLQLQQQEDMLLEHRLQAALELFPKNTSHTQSAQEELISGKEAVMCELLQTINNVLWKYEQSISYVENMLREQLYQAIGREIKASDFDQYMEFHMKKLFATDYLPTLFSHAIRQPQEYPVGIAAIETEMNENQPIQTYSRRIRGGKDQSPIRVPINAATSVELIGDRILSGWVRYQFQEHGSMKAHSSLVARARQFSSYMLLIGTMTGPDTFDPKHAIILQNKDEVIIPLLTEVLPSAKEFKDAIASMSPEQQEFARAFRAMQLESSLFAICLIQLKPQLELLLNLPKGCLSKEIQLTEDLMSLFIDYQIPSDLLSYDGAPDASSAPEKVEVVRKSVEQVLKIISDAKELQLKEEVQKAKTREAMQHKMQDESTEFAEAESMPSAAPSSTPSAAPSSTPSSSWESSWGYQSDSDKPRVASRHLRRFDVEMQSLRGGHSQQQTDDAAQSQTLYSKEAKSGDHTSTATTTAAAEDFTAIPGILDAMLEKHDTESFLRSTIIKAATSQWTRKRQENLLTPPTTFDLVESDIANEKAKAFDLLDAISRSGTLPIASSELHVVVGMTHCFERSLVDTVVQDNVNPILKAEKSALMVASTIFGKATPTAYLASEDDIQRLSTSFPNLFVEIDDGINNRSIRVEMRDAASENDSPSNDEEDRTEEDGLYNENTLME